MTNPTIKRLSSGYWLVRWNQNLWIQWPIRTQATLADGFGWITDAHVVQANVLASAISR